MGLVIIFHNSPLVNQKADINAKSYDVRTPLHFASENGHLSVVEYLVNQKADIHEKDNVGRTPMELACSITRFESEDKKKRKSNVVEFLKSKGI